MRTGVSSGIGVAPYVSEVAGWLPEDVDATAPVCAAAAGPSGRILLADDNRDMREYLRRLLSGAYAVRAVADGAAALAAIRDDRPDLVIADVVMPRLDGLELVRALRAEPDTRTLPVILLSAQAGEAARVEGIAAGATDYVLKPFHARELLARVTARLEIGRLAREIFERERRLRTSLLDGMADRYYAFDAEWRYTELNAKAEAQLRALGKDPAAMIGKVLWDEFPHSPGERRLRSAMLDRQPTVDEHYHAPLGEWVQNRIEPSAGGGVVVFQRYITEAKRLEHDLRRMATYLADAEALSHTGTWAWNPTTGELFWSAEHFKILGLDAARVTPTYDVGIAAIHPDDRAMLETSFTRAVAHRQPYALSCRVVRPDGEVRHIRTLARPVLGESGDLLEYVGTVIDLTDHVRTEEALRRSREELAHVTRVMSLGALTASIGHDLNQFVVAIVANGTACLHWLAREQPNLDEATAAVRRIMRDAELIGDVVGNVRAFLGKAAQPSTDLDLAAVIREVRELVEPEATRHRVVIEETLAEGLPRARGVRIEVQQVLLNLMTNAIDAMAGITDGPRVVRVRAEPDSRARATAVLVAIEDSGTGFAGVDERRLYDAFYTTKPHGLGMGLSIAHSIVERHGGRLWATPNAVHGVTFQFMLPVEPLP